MQTVVSPRPDPGKRKFPLWKVWACYITALLFTGLILATIIGAVSSLLPDSWKGTISAWSLLEYTGLAFLIVYFTRMIGDIWRSRSEDLKLGFTDLPNPFYDENFVKAPHRLQKEIRALQDELEQARKEGERTAAYLRAVNQRAEFYERKMEEMNKKLTVFTRHHENARRLLGSAAYLLYIGEEWRSEMLNNILSECLTCLEKDHSDKSAALFKVYGEELRIEHYIRLSARSARSVRLKKGEGFAGKVWEAGEAQYIPDIQSANEYFGAIKPSDDYRSIVGIPIRANGEVLGVLCVQSEVVDGFTKQDLRTLRFYAHACSLIFVYDILKAKMSAEGVDRE
ncbi:GAF domain-containing protein (plasmid) [Thermobacillus composti KWC4]|uniref:GAF domain-containing protein n=1 Tax=Thermobacillus composti (strain DSM 18247 / JCM 13945 / KWC4) TaxID=717605 RepID=L0EJX6_THECK|nr:GAF domain-containing protein [Thermobacillus composti]AGA60096.1 GAF domain-containing protein [Thermobacillus composti KWC4]